MSEGNPLFVREMIRLGCAAARRSTTAGMKATLDEHLGMLTSETRGLLEAAAVLGRDFGSRELAEMSASAHDIVKERRGHGVELGVLEPSSRSAISSRTCSCAIACTTRWRPRIRARCTGQPASSRRRTAPIRPRLRTTCWPELLLAIERSPRRPPSAAAQNALSTLAFEAAADVAERGLTLLGSETSPVACALEIACGEGRILSGAMEAGHAHCVRAAGMAQQLGLPHEQAHAALVYGAELTGGSSVDAVMVNLLERAIAAAGPDDSPLAAKLGARLATALRPPHSEKEAARIADVARAALAMARRLGDSETLVYVLEFARIGLIYIGSCDEVFELTREALALAQVLERRLTLLKLGAPYATGLLERGHSCRRGWRARRDGRTPPGDRLPAEPVALADAARRVLCLRRPARRGSGPGGRRARARRTCGVASRPSSSGRLPPSQSRSRAAATRLDRRSRPALARDLRAKPGGRASSLGAGRDRPTGRGPAAPS